MSSKNELILNRARSAIGKGIRYSLGCGGWDPTDALPATLVWRRPRGKVLPVRALWLDCSGFIAWCVGLSRKTTIFRGKWGISTVSIHKDAMGPGKWFKLLEPGEPIRPGDIAVYPDRRDTITKKTIQGHTAVVVDAAKRLVIDCGSSSDGVTERVATFWNKCIFCRFVG